MSSSLWVFTFSAWVTEEENPFFHSPHSTNTRNHESTTGLACQPINNVIRCLCSALLAHQSIEPAQCFFEQVTIFLSHDGCRCALRTSDQLSQGSIQARQTKVTETVLTSPTSPTDMDAVSPNADMPCSLDVAEWCSGDASSCWKPSLCCSTCNAERYA